jgi:hypothetical protein
MRNLLAHAVNGFGVDPAAPRTNNSRDSAHLSARHLVDSI